ncbi:MAG TPA: hypothetical protein VFH61_04650, partial [Thermoleophilia bacterium]|nr:hypothetical protein [Thermoleophilia bacterium]
MSAPLRNTPTRTPKGERRSKSLDDIFVQLFEIRCEMKKLREMVESLIPKATLRHASEPCEKCAKQGEPGIAIQVGSDGESCAFCGRPLDRQIAP